MEAAPLGNEVLLALRTIPEEAAEEGAAETEAVDAEENDEESEDEGGEADPPPPPANFLPNNEPKLALRTRLGTVGLGAAAACACKSIALS